MGDTEAPGNDPMSGSDEPEGPGGPAAPDGTGGPGGPAEPDVSNEQGDDNKFNIPTDGGHVRLLFGFIDSMTKGPPQVPNGYPDGRLKNAMTFIANNYESKPNIAPDLIELLGEINDNANVINNNLETKPDKVNEVLKVACRGILLYKVLLDGSIDTLAREVAVKGTVEGAENFVHEDKRNVARENQLADLQKLLTAVTQAGTSGGRRMKKKTKKMNRKFLRNKSKKLKKPKKTKKGKKGKKGKKKRKTHKK